MVEGSLTGGGDLVELGPFAGGQRLVGLQPCGGLDAGFDGLGQPHLVRGGQQVDLAELTEVEIEQVLGNRVVACHRSSSSFRPFPGGGCCRDVGRTHGTV